MVTPPVVSQHLSGHVREHGTVAGKRTDLKQDRTDLGRSDDAHELYLKGQILAGQRVIAVESHRGLVYHDDGELH